MKKSFIKLSIFIFVFSMFNLQNSFAQNVPVQSQCKEIFATYSKAVVSADDLTINNWPICVKDLDEGQSVTVSASRGSLSKTSFKTPVENGITIYSDTFTVGYDGRTTFNANDSAGGSATIAYLDVSIRAAIIGYTGPADGSKYNAPEPKTITCTNSTYIKVNGDTVKSGAGTLSYTLTTSANVASYTIICGNIGGDQVTRVINIAAPVTNLTQGSGNTTKISSGLQGDFNMYYESTGVNPLSPISTNCTNCTILKIERFVWNGSAWVRADFLTESGNTKTISASGPSWSTSFNFDNEFKNVLDDSRYVITSSNAGTETSIKTIFVKAKPITIKNLSIAPTTPSSPINLSWDTNAKTCGVYNFNGGIVLVRDFTNNVSAGRDFKSWSATIPAISVPSSDGTYGYYVACSDVDHTTRAVSSDNKTSDQVKRDEGVSSLANSTSPLAWQKGSATISSKPIATIAPDTNNPNFLNWKCVNSKYAWIKKGNAQAAKQNTLQGTLPNDGTTYVLTCGNDSDNINDTGNNSKTYNPSTLTPKEIKRQDGKPQVSVNYSCPAGTSRAELYRDPGNIRLLPINGTSGTYEDNNVTSGSTYTYKLFCRDSNNNLIAYSQKQITLSSPENPTPEKPTDGDRGTSDTPTSCTYNSSESKINCSNIPECSDGSYAKQENNLTAGGNQTPNISTAGGTSKFDWIDKVYQYKFICTQNVPCPKEYVLNPNTGKCEFTKIIKAVTPPYTHFISFNVSSPYVQAGSNVNLNWNIQKPNDTCKITAKYISGNNDVYGGVYKDYLDDEMVKNNVTGANANDQDSIPGSKRLIINRSTRFVASCTERGFVDTILNGRHQIVKDVYVIGEREQ